MQTFTEQTAKRLAKEHNDELRDDIAAGLEFAYRARRNCDGTWCVWCDTSDHHVEVARSDSE